ncbi:hypothetical protein EXIGLDRAFT_841571 [Exidia glandulosa HHB12029]|uniref:Mid2 domain-containing protein n=1 Tax=Exidia glandulosa HHB12029 TaxID=1314781 RepID=A0A165DTR4_EXIGL|nr:hypothetical protein EXIGLDRAFT_841571 [Exidia glandulosa HHB12029]
MRSVLVLAAALFVALARAQDNDVITPAIVDEDSITPLVTGTEDGGKIIPLVTPSLGDEITPTVTPVTHTICTSATAVATPGVYGVDIDPYNPPAGWDCVLTWPQGGGVWTVPIVPPTTHKNNIVKIVVPIVVAVAAALALLGIGLYAVRRRARRAHSTATTRPWFKRQGWVNGSKANVAEVDNKVAPAMTEV